MLNFAVGADVQCAMGVILGMYLFLSLFEAWRVGVAHGRCRVCTALGRCALRSFEVAELERLSALHILEWQLAAEELQRIAAGHVELAPCNSIEELDRALLQVVISNFRSAGAAVIDGKGNILADLWRNSSERSVHLLRRCVTFRSFAQEDLGPIELGRSVSGDLASLGIRWLLSRRCCSDKEAKTVLMLFYEYPSPLELRAADKLTTLYGSLVNQTRERARLVAEAEAAVAHSREPAGVVAQISHDLRAPLNTLGFVLSSLSESGGIAQREEFDELLAVAERSRKTLGEMVEVLLDYSLSHSGALPREPRDFSLKTLLKELRSEFLLPARDKGLLVELSEPSSDAVINADPLQVRRIFLNLLTNALKFTEHGGITISLSVTDRRAIAVVADTGVGLKPEQIAQLFLPFVRHRRDRDGLGLGLTVCKRLVEINNGTIIASPRESGGLEITVDFPLVSGRNSQHKRCPRVLWLGASADMRAKLRACTVERESEIVDAAEVKSALELFRFFGPEVVVVGSARLWGDFRQAALERFGDLCVLPPALLCEVQLREGSSASGLVFEVLEQGTSSHDDRMLNDLRLSVEQLIGASEDGYRSAPREVQAAQDGSACHRALPQSAASIAECCAEGAEAHPVQFQDEEGSQGYTYPPG